MSDTKEYCKQINEYNKRVASKSGINIGQAKTTIEMLSELAKWHLEREIIKYDRK